MIRLESFKQSDFSVFISWIDSKELLVTIAGYDLILPLTEEQLQAYLDNPKSYSFTIMDDTNNKPIGHAEILLTPEETGKIDKLLIGDTSLRGKGLGKEVIQLLLEYAFEKLQLQTVELNVFDWNTGALKLYEKCGFILNPEKRQVFEFENNTWIAVNMRLNRAQWIKSLVK